MTFKPTRQFSRYTGKRSRLLKPNDVFEIVIQEDDHVNKRAVKRVATCRVVRKDTVRNKISRSHDYRTIVFEDLLTGKEDERQEDALGAFEGYRYIGVYRRTWLLWFLTLGQLKYRIVRA